MNYTKGLGQVVHDYSILPPIIYLIFLINNYFTSGLVSSFTETEKELVAVERCVQYLENIPSEKMLGEHNFKLRTRVVPDTEFKAGYPQLELFFVAVMK